MIVFAVALAIAAQPPAAQPSAASATAQGEAANRVEADNAPRIGQAMAAVQAHRPQEALDILAPAIAAYEADHARETRRIYCATSGEETLAYMLMAAGEKVSAVAIADSYCSALYLKGYALVELKRLDEAKVAYKKAIAMAPLNAQYQVEYAQLLALEKDWPGMLAACEQAQGHAKLGPPPVRRLRQGAALRCQGYALVELNRLDDAEARYKQALKIDRNDRKAQAELRYIAETRAKTGPKSGT